jgi:hypothetical protein
VILILIEQGWFYHVKQDTRFVIAYCQIQEFIKTTSQFQARSEKSQCQARSENLKYKISIRFSCQGEQTTQ